MDSHTYAPNDPKGQIANLANRAANASNTATVSLFARIAQRLVELAQPQPGDVVLDVAPGTGVAAVYAASKVAPTGQVVVIDFDMGTPAQDTPKPVARWAAPVELPKVDSGPLSFEDNTFDLVLCASGPFWLPDMLAGLRAWRRLLRPGGTIAISGYGNQAFQPLASLFQTSVRGCGLTISDPIHPFPWQHLSELEQYYDLLRNAGFSTIDVRGEQHGCYLANSEEWWDILCNSGFRALLAQLPPASLAQFKMEHLSAVAELTAAQGIWMNLAVIFAVGQKNE